MKSSLIYQPAQQLGHELLELLDEEQSVKKITLVSAFVALRSVLRLRDAIMFHKHKGALIRLVVGIDLGGTSKEALEEILLWGCESYVFHNPNPRSTFHPKVYLVEKDREADLYVGSSNLTDGGFYTNYEVISKFSFEISVDRSELTNLISPISALIEPSEGEVVKILTSDLIRVLSDRGELPSESETRRRKREIRNSAFDSKDRPKSPFTAVTVPFAPQVRSHLKEGNRHDTISTTDLQVQRPRALPRLPQHRLVWRKVLKATDALQVGSNTSHVGGVRLIQARYRDADGNLIDQTKYFRELFADYDWEQETGRQRPINQEHTFIPMRLVIRGEDFGVHNFEVSYGPSREAKQRNHTTVLRWGRNLTALIQSRKITGETLLLFEGGDEEDFRIEIGSSPQHT